MAYQQQIDKPAVIDYAPIALFVYGRAEHTRRTLEALRSNELAEASDLFIFSDGAKNEAATAKVTDVRALLRQITGFRTVTIIERDQNYGLAKSIVDGVTTLCARFGRVIVVEDDLLTSPTFLTYMNLGLNRYADSPKVFQVAAYNLCGNLPGTNDAFFLPFSSSWGWATWSRAWAIWDAEGSGFERLQSDKSIRYQFDLNGSYPFFRMLCDQRLKKNDSWAIRWYLAVFLAGGLVLYPRKSLVENIGFDGSGEHCGNETSDVTRSFDSPPQNLPAVAETSVSDYIDTCKFLRKGGSTAGSGPQSLIRRISKWLKN